MRHLRTLCYAVLLVLSTLVLYQLWQYHQQYRIVKEDLITLSDVRYGLFNVDEWKVVASDIISAKVAALDLSNEDRAALRIRIIRFLTSAIDDFETRYHEEKSKSIKGFLQRGVASLTGTFGQLKKDIPVFADQILAFIDEKENREALRQYILDQVDSYAETTFSKVDYALVEAVLERHALEDVFQAKSELAEEVFMIQSGMRWWTYALGAAALFACLLLLLGGALRRIDVVLAVGIALSMLIGGLILPMIEIDARIAELTFLLLGEEVAFTDQVLFYKSKSILEVIHLLLTQGGPEVVGVGVLILVFSVLFPLSKLLATLYDTVAQNEQRSGLMTFLLYQSGKWSMADVFVVAIFMAYIGFDSILSDQLSQLSGMAKTVSVITTDTSALLVGFYAFLAYVLVSLCLSQRMMWSHRQAQR